MMNSRYREQYTDAVAVHLRDQEVAGLDICTDGDAHYDEEVAGQSWTSYPLFHNGGVRSAQLAAAVDDSYYKDPFERIMAFSDALNEELHDLADAGCAVIQIEEPSIHMIPVRGKVFGKHDMHDMAQVFDNTVRGLREKTEALSMRQGIWADAHWHFLLDTLRFNEMG